MTAIICHLEKEENKLLNRNTLHNVRCYRARIALVLRQFSKMSIKPIIHPAHLGNKYILRFREKISYYTATNGISLKRPYLYNTTLQGIVRYIVQNSFYLRTMSEIRI